MKNLNSLFVVGVLPLASLQGAVISTFESGDDGWTVSGDSESAIPDLVAVGGNPDGHISASDTAVGGVWYWSAPAKFEGDQSDKVGGSLSFDLQQSATSSQFNSTDVRVVGATITLAYNTAINPGTSWTSYTVPLTPGPSWFVGTLSSGVLATQADFDSVFSGISDLQIRGEFRTGADSGQLDNILLVPEPSSGVMVLLSALCLLGVRKRR